MSETLEDGTVRRNHLPNWAKTLVRGLGVATAVILASAAFLSALGKFGDAVQAPCALLPQLSWCPAAVSKAPPKLDPYTTDWVGGGHNRAEYCEPRKQAYQTQYPDFVIDYTASEENDKDWKGHATYRYSCIFTAAATTAAK